MPVHDNESLISKVKKGIEKSGFPLEMEIGNILTQNKWLVRYSPFFLDYEDLRYKEFDILGFQNDGPFEIRLFIECKHSADKQWVFFVPDEFNTISVRDLRFFPIKQDIFFLRLKDLRNTVFGSIYAYRDPIRIALNSSTFRGHEKDDSKGIKEAISTTMKALIASNVPYFTGKPEPPFKNRPNLNLSIVVFDGPMFVYRRDNSEFVLESSNYVLYRHEMRFDIWKQAEHIRSEPVMSRCHEYESLVGHDQLVEIVHKDEFVQYLSELDKSIATINAIPKWDFVDKTKEWFDTETLLDPPWAL